MENFALTVDRWNVLCYQFTLTQVIVKHRLQHVSGVSQLGSAPADTCYITVSYKVTSNLGLHKKSLTPGSQGDAN